MTAPAAAVDIHALLHPRNIVIAGASDNPTSWTNGIRASLQWAGFPGPVFAVNPNRPTVWDEPCYADFDLLPEKPDHVVVAVAAPRVAEVIRRASLAGARSATIFSAGFGEGVADEATFARRDELSRIIAESGMTVSGPNCMGNFCAESNLLTMNERRLRTASGGAIAIAGQSGGIVTAIQRSLLDRGLAAAYAITTGNELGAEMADYVEYFATRSELKTIICYVESLRDGPRFARAVRQATGRGTAVLVYKSGRSEQGRRAGESHTGKLVGSYEAFVALLRDTGAARLDTIDDVIDATELSAFGAAVRGRRIGFVSLSGGLKGIVVDELARAGLALAELSESTKQALDVYLAKFGLQAENPADIGSAGIDSLDTYKDCVRLVRDDPGIDGVLVQEELIRESSYASKLRYLTALDELAQENDQKFVAAFSMLSHSVTDYGRELRTTELTHLPLLQSPARAVRVVAEAGRAYEQRSAEARPTAVGVASGRIVTLGEPEAKDRLTVAGIPVPRGFVAASASEARQRASELHAPFVVKGVVDGVLHKSELGLVRLGIGEGEEIDTAFAQITAAVAHHQLTDRFTGCLVEEMVGGVEMLLSARGDPEAGPIIVVGVGGLTAELANDVAVAVAPVNAVRAREMIDSLAAAQLLQGYRGAPPADVAALVAAIVALSETIAADSSLKEIEINPLVVQPEGQGVTAVDAVATVWVKE